ncbi:hypothetical protein AURDEDRAFT_151369 [Auricularia subglabra TFB-10046 SS5]|nr:hypothetical protein AURDEDRAFT_151369 [Auricularia subglabra TFB-10046 SS5]
MYSAVPLNFNTEDVGNGLAACPASDYAADYLDLAANAVLVPRQTALSSRTHFKYARRANSEPPASTIARYKSKYDLAAGIEQSARVRRKKLTRAVCRSPVKSRPPPSPIATEPRSGNPNTVHRDYKMDCDSDSDAEVYYASSRGLQADDIANYAHSRGSTPGAITSAEADQRDDEHLSHALGGLELNSNPFSACSAVALQRAIAFLESGLQAASLSEPEHRQAYASDDEDDPAPALTDLGEYAGVEAPSSPASSSSSIVDDSDEAVLDQAANLLDCLWLYPKLCDDANPSERNILEIYEAISTGPVPVKFVRDAIPVCERAGWPLYPTQTPAPRPPSPTRSQDAVATRRSERRCKASAPYGTRARTILPNPLYPLRPVTSWE